MEYQNEQINNFLDYCYHNMSKEQYCQVRKFNDSQLLFYLVYSYNCYVITKNESRWQTQLILNPDALFRRKEDEDAFIKTIKIFISDITGIEIEVIENEECRNHQPETKTIKNK